MLSFKTFVPVLTGIPILFFCAANCGREMVCEAIYKGICLDITSADVELFEIKLAIDAAEYEFKSQYDIDFNLYELAEDNSLVVYFLPKSGIDIECGLQANGCYEVGSSIIFAVSDTYGSERSICITNMHVIGHELLHFFSDKILRREKPEYFEEKGFLETETAHMTPHLWLDWAEQNDLYPGQSVEGRVLFEAVNICLDKYPSEPQVGDLVEN